jgi:hypothetical protein
MIVQQYPISVYRGDCGHWRFFLFKGDTTEPYDLRDAVAKAEIRTAPSGTLLATMDCVITPPNIIDVDLPSDQSGALDAKTATWDLQLTWPDACVRTVLYGPVTVTFDVTDSTLVGAP